MKIVRYLDRYFEPSIVVVLVATMTMLIVAQILLRLVGVSLSQAEEVSRILFVWAIYLSISYAIRDDRHIRIRVLVQKLPMPARILAENLADLVFAAYCFIVVVFGLRIVNRSLELGQIVPATEMSVAVIYLSVVVSSLLCLIRLTQRMLARLKAENSGQDS